MKLGLLRECCFSLTSSCTTTCRYLNGVTARRIIDYLKTHDFTSSLKKLRQAEKADKYRYSLWEHHSDKFLLTSESMFMQKVKYIHNNPVKEGLVEKPDDYYFSSARIWIRKQLDKEPMEMDYDQIK